MSNNVNFAKDSMQALKVHTELMKLLYQAIGCHSEVMGMMSENMLCACTGEQPLFGTLAFTATLRKWGMIDEKGEPKL